MGNRADDLARRLRVSREMYTRAVAFARRHELFKIPRQILERMLLDPSGKIAQAFAVTELRQCLGRVA